MDPAHWRQWGKGSAVLKKKDCPVKTTGVRFYKQYLDKMAPVLPSPHQAGRNQVLLGHFSCKQMSIVQHRNEKKGIQYH